MGYVALMAAFFGSYVNFKDKECTRSLSIWTTVQLMLYILFSVKHFIQAIVYMKCIDPILVMIKVEFLVLPTLYLF